MHKVLIIGSGISALSSAIRLKEQGVNIVVATKSVVTKNNSVMAQGGINAALGNRQRDSVDLHIEDTIKSAHKLADSQMVAKLCHGGIEAVKFLEQIGVPFSRLEDASSPLGSIAQRKLGGASSKRACYAQDYTGLKILHTLLDRAINLDIEIIEGLFLLELIKNSNGEVCGSLFFNTNSAELEPIYANKILVATGGYAGVYSKNTNSKGSTGDGISAILRAGGELSNMEFVQFHPTTLKGSNILISESARGEGGYLVNSDGERFVNELDSRDVVAKACFKQILQGKQVYLDLHHIGKENLEHLMPQELKLIKTYAGVDASEELVEIEPAVHYTMGGANVNKSFKVAGLKGCYCVGEASEAKVHGANRLGGNSLLEATAFGLLVANELQKSDGSKIEQTKVEYRLPIAKNSDNFKVYRAKKILSETLYKNVGIIRDEESLNQALKKIQKLDIDNIYIDDNLQNSTLLIDLLELKNAKIVAIALIKSALWRKESRGAHIRGDYPSKSQEFETNSIYKL